MKEWGKDSKIWKEISETVLEKETVAKLKVILMLIGRI